MNQPQSDKVYAAASAYYTPHAYARDQIGIGVLRAPIIRGAWAHDTNPHAVRPWAGAVPFKADAGPAF